MVTCISVDIEQDVTDRLRSNSSMHAQCSERLGQHRPKDYAQSKSIIVKKKVVTIRIVRGERKRERVY